MEKLTAEEIARKINAQSLWERALQVNWAVKPRGTAFPYFCTLLKEESPQVKIRFLLLEGWQTFHDYVRCRVDHDFGFYISPIEFSQFQIVVGADDSVRLYRHDPGYVPIPVASDDPRRELCAKILWESYGIMLRLESEPGLPLKYAGEKAMFARVENAAGEWEDAALPIPDPRPQVEKVSLPTELLKKAKDLPMAENEHLEIDLMLHLGLQTNEPRPRSAYLLGAVLADSGEKIIWRHASIDPENGLRGLWEGMPVQVLADIVNRGRIPGEITVRNGRMFRMLRPLMHDLPFKLSLRSRLSALEKLLV